MRAPGYCATCRRFRYVLVSSHAFAAHAAGQRPVLEGICAECEAAERGARGGQGRGLKRRDELGRALCGRCGEPYGVAAHGPGHCAPARPRP